MDFTSSNPNDERKCGITSRDASFGLIRALDLFSETTNYSVLQTLFLAANASFPVIALTKMSTKRYKPLATRELAANVAVGVWRQGKEKWRAGEGADAARVTVLRR